MRRRLARRSVGGMTLIELLVAMSILVVVMLAITAAMGTMQNMWVRIRGKADAFRGTRIALDTMAQRVNQATLHSRWEMNPDPATAAKTPYVRGSDLHFVSGPASLLLAPAGRYSGHALFFQGPFGEPASSTGQESVLEYDQLGHTLCGWGYFVEFGSDDQERPDFLVNVQDRFPPRRRFRLWEFRQPAQGLTLFEMNEDTPPKTLLSTYTSKEQIYEWFNKPLRSQDLRTRHASVVAENILALIVTPFDPAKVTNNNQYRLAPDGHFDSRRYQWDRGTETSGLSQNRLPPALRLTVIALSEDSWQRMTTGEIEATANKLKTEVSSRFTQPDRFEQDLDSLTGQLNRIKMGYRVITTNLKMPEQ